MGAGRASGKDLDYQELCRDLVRYGRKDLELEPFSGDGVDIPFQAGGTVWTFDVALKCPGNLILVECKRWSTAVSQGDLAEFAHKVEKVRGTMPDTLVSGIFIAKTDVNQGLLKAAGYEGIDVLICDDGVDLTRNFHYSGLRYDSSRDARLTMVHQQLVDKVGVGDSVTYKIVRGS